MDENQSLEISKNENKVVALAHRNFDDFDDNNIGALLEKFPPRALGQAFYSLAKAYYDKADLDKAEAAFKEAIKGIELPTDIFAKFKILGFLVRIASEKHDIHSADVYIKQSEQLMNYAQDELGTLTSEYFYNLGALNNYKSDFELAHENFMLAMKKSKEENEPNVLAKSLYSLATWCCHEKEYEKALDYLNQLNELLFIIKKTYFSGTLYLLYANVYTELEKFDTAEDYFNKASYHFRKKSCWNLKGYVLHGKGIMYKKMGSFKKASWCFDQAMNDINPDLFKRLYQNLQNEISDLNDSNVDIYLDRTNRVIHEKNLGTIDFKHRFVLLEILFLLAQNAGKYYDKEDLARDIWKDEYNPLIHDKLIYTSISRLRKLIEPKDRSDKRKYIIRGKDGYTFNPDVKTRFHRDSRHSSHSAIANIEISSPV